MNEIHLSWSDGTVQGMREGGEEHRLPRELRGVQGVCEANGGSEGRQEEDEGNQRDDVLAESEETQEIAQD